MSFSSSAHLIYGIDFGNEMPPGLKGYDHLAEWVDSGDAEPAVIFVTHCSGDKIILGVKGHLRTSNVTPLAINSLAVDREAAEQFIAALVAIGVKDPQPQWLLVDDTTF